MIQFDTRGFVKPYHVQKCDLKDFDQTFVRNLNSLRRQELFNYFKLYLDSLHKVLEKDFSLRIDGSFVTKKESPADIDLVCFVDWKIYEKVEGKIEKLKYPLSLETYQIDGYFVKVYPKSHKKFSLYEGDKLYWYHQFSQTKRNRRGNRFPKGFIELNF